MSTNSREAGRSFAGDTLLIKLLLRGSDTLRCVCLPPMPVLNRDTTVQLEPHKKYPHDDNAVAHTSRDAVKWYISSTCDD